MATIDAGLCERLISAATSHCASSPPPIAAIVPSADHSANWDGVVTSLAALSADMALALLILAVVTVALGLGWGYLVKMWAEREAKAEAQAAAKKWLSDNGPALVREYLDLLSPVTQPNAPSAPGSGDSDADQIAENA